MSGSHIERLLGVILLAVTGCASDTAHRDAAVAAEAKAVEFLKREVPAWSQKNGCFSCHNNGDAARALFAAAQKGHGVPPSALADTKAWITRPSRWDDNKGDPGFSDKRLANIQFAAALLAGIEAGSVKRDLSLDQAARKIAHDQAPDGSWPVEPQNAVGSPATYGTVLATWMALRVLDRAAVPEIHGAAQLARDWLEQAKPDNVPTAATLILLAEKQPQVEQSLILLHRAQGRDGGWGPYPDVPPEVFDTALALLALETLQRKPGVNEMIQRGREFLVGTQNSDGSWPATTRPSGGESYAQQVSTTGWATLALLATRAQR